MVAGEPKENADEEGTAADFDSVAAGAVGAPKDVVRGGKDGAVVAVVTVAVEPEVVGG